MRWIWRPQASLMLPLISPDLAKMSLALMLGGAAVVYFGVLLLAGVQLRQFVRK